MLSRDPVATEALHRAYRKRAGMEPVYHESKGLAYDDLGTINGTRVFHHLVAENEDWDEVRAAIDQVLALIQPVTVLEVGCAESSAPNRHSPGELLIVEGVQNGDNLGEVSVQATSRLVEACSLAQSSWQGRPVHNGIL